MCISKLLYNNSLHLARIAFYICIGLIAILMFFEEHRVAGALFLAAVLFFGSLAFFWNKFRFEGWLMLLLVSLWFSFQRYLV